MRNGLKERLISIRRANAGEKFHSDLGDIKVHEEEKGELLWALFSRKLHKSKNATEFKSRSCYGKRRDIK